MESMTGVLQIVLCVLLLLAAFKQSTGPVNTTFDAIKYSLIGSNLLQTYLR